MEDRANVVSRVKGEKKLDSKETACFPEKRRAKRIHVPVTSTAIFSNSAGSMDKIYIKDISVVGMLLCDYFGSAKNHPLGSSIYNINVDIPVSEYNADNRNSFNIDRGKVVRSFIDQSTDKLCYGIEFTLESPHIKEKIERLVNNA